VSWLRVWVKVLPMSNMSLDIGRILTNQMKGTGNNPIQIMYIYIGRR